MTRRLGWPIRVTGWTRRRALRWAALAVAAYAGLSGWWHLAAGPAPADGWVVECVECAKRFHGMRDRSLRLDDAGHPHIAFGGDHLYYTWHDGAAWHTETVDTSPDVGRQASLALDGDGNPHITYHACGYASYEPVWRDCSVSELRYAYRDASGWHIETVGYGEGEYASLAVDSRGHPHVSYQGASSSGRFGDALVYAYRDSSGWQTETLYSQQGFGVAHYGSLALDENDYAHISFDGVGDLMYAYQDAAGWHVETAFNGTRANHSSLALDENVHAHVVFEGYRELRYAYRDTAGWHVEVVSPLLAGTLSTSLALDAMGKVHIGYFDWNSYDLKYAYQGAGGWNVETVDGDRWSGVDASLAVDGSGNVHISYQNWVVEDLRYAQRDATGWQLDILEKTELVGWALSLALDGNGRAQISYRDVANEDLKHAHQNASGWQTEMVDGVGDVGNWPSLALDAGGWPHISYHDRDLGQLKHAYQDAAGWHLETVDSGVDANANTSLALDTSGFAHVSYREAGDLRYGYNDTAGWHRETVDEEGYTGWKSSLALDGDGAPHISYVDETNADVRYAFRDAAGWHTETVDNGPWVRLLDTSLALDREGWPHIGYNYCAYEEETEDGWFCEEWDLRYARKDAAGWHIETLALWPVQPDISLALDRSGYPHLTFAGYVSLHYAFRDAAGWHVQTVDYYGPRVSVGDFNSLALDGDGNAHIAYLSLTEQDLKYAHNAIPRMRWVGPGDDMLLTRAGALLEVAYANIAVPDTMTATLSGPATFADGTQILSVVITSTKGAHLLALRPAAEPTPPGEFNLHLTLADLELDTSGTVARETFLPSLAQGHPACPPSVDQVALYVESGYMGQCVVKGVGDYPTYRDIGLPFDSVSSLRVGAHVRATLCSDGQFGGTCEVFTADDITLVDNPVGDDEVSSVRVEPRPGAE